MMKRTIVGIQSLRLANLAKYSVTEFLSRSLKVDWVCKRDSAIQQ